MRVRQNDKLVVAISSRALFDLDASNRLFEEEGLEAYRAYQLQHEKDVLAPGSAFAIVQKFLKLNENVPASAPRVEVILLSRNTADTGLRIFNSIRHYGLNIKRAVFSGGKSPYVYAKAFGADLYLSLNQEDIRQALQAGCAAATLWPTQKKYTASEALNFAFDGDAVLFSDEAEIIYKTKGLSDFNASEIEKCEVPLAPGPFKGFLSALHDLQQQSDLPLPIRTALVTARSAPAHERVIHTLRAWGIRVDESLFLGGLSKSEFLKAFQADIFFDDQTGYCEGASEHVTTCHVPYGISNQAIK